EPGRRATPRALLPPDLARRYVERRVRDVDLAVERIAFRRRVVLLERDRDVAADVAARERLVDLLGERSAGRVLETGVPHVLVRVLVVVEPKRPAHDHDVGARRDRDLVDVGGRAGDL